jgi:hypothetical protein
MLVGLLRAIEPRADAKTHSLAPVGALRSRGD